MAEFEGSVVVKDPQFTLFCDQLRVTMSKDRKGLQLVEAFGNVIIVEHKTDEAGKKVKSTGRSGKAVLNRSRAMSLSPNGPLSSTMSHAAATEQGTVMILNRAGKMTTKGGSRTATVDNSTQE